jgi:hypothetical protein
MDAIIKSAVCLVIKAKKSQTPAQAKDFQDSAFCSVKTPAKIKNRNNESTRAISNHAPQALKVAAYNPAAMIAARKLLVSRHTIKYMNVKQPKEARRDNNRRLKKLKPKTLVNIAAK